MTSNLMILTVCESIIKTDAIILKSILILIQWVSPIVLLILVLIDFNRAKESCLEDAFIKVVKRYKIRMIISIFCILLPLIIQLIGLLFNHDLSCITDIKI